MENTIEVERAEVIMDILLENNITRNGESPSKTFLVKQNHQPVCTIFICCSECHCKFIIITRFFHLISYITLLKGKGIY